MCAAEAKRPPNWAFPPGAPLRRGGVYPLKAGGAELRSELYGAERRGAPHPSAATLWSSTPHISASCVPQKGGLLFSGMARMGARLAGRMAIQRTRPWRAWEEAWWLGPGCGGHLRGRRNVRCPLHFTAHQDCVLFRRLKFGRRYIDHGAPDREVCGQIARTFGVGPEEASTSQRRPGK